MNVGIVAIWSLLESCRSGTEAERHAAAEEAVRAFGDGRGCDLRLDGSVLYENDLPVVTGADTFVATHTVVERLRDAGVRRVRLQAVGAAGLRHWAEQVVAGAVCAGEHDGVTTELVDAADGPSGRDAKGGAPGAGGASRLQSVFLQYSLIERLPPVGGIDPAIAKLIVQAVVERLLRVAGGLEPLMLLQRDDRVLHGGTAVCVLTALLARRAGWPSEELADIGAAALLHDVGSVLDAADPARAGFRWLLSRGDSDFWLRSAMVARHWRGDAVPEGSDLAVVGLVRLAVAMRDGGVDAIGPAVEGELVPRELGDVARLAVAAG